MSSLSHIAEEDLTRILSHWIPSTDWVQLVTRIDCFSLCLKLKSKTFEALGEPLVDRDVLKFHGSHREQWRRNKSQKIKFEIYIHAIVHIAKS